MPISSKPLSVLFAVHGYKPAYRLGGPILSVAALAEGLAARGHRVVVFTTNSNLDEDLDVPTNSRVMIDGVEVWYFKRSEPLKKAVPFLSYISKSMGFLYSRELGNAARQRIKEFDLAHTHLPFVYPTHAVGGAAIKARKPLFCHQRGVYDPERLKFRGAKKRLYIAICERPMLRRATTLIALTEAERDSYRALGVNTPCKIVPNGIDPDKYFRTPSEELFRHLPIGREGIVVLYLARLHPTKGGDLLLEAFLKTGRQFPNATLVLAGPDEWGLEMQFKNRVEEAGMGGRVLFPGMVSGRLKLDLLARADVFCLPSVAEGFSMAVLEALASATPVMISPGCHFSEVAKVGAGWIVERRVEDWANKLAEILREPEQLKRAGESCLQLVRSHYTWGSIVGQMEEAYREGLTRHDSRQ
jgi:glycosyltransferase involved in cell wall biosynthesis